MLGSEIKVCPVPFGEVLASPNAQRLFISSPSIRLSLGGLLSSRARFCFTGQQKLTNSIDSVNDLDTNFLRPSSEDAQAQPTTLVKMNGHITCSRSGQIDVLTTDGQLGQTNQGCASLSARKVAGVFGQRSAESS